MRVGSGNGVVSLRPPPWKEVLRAQDPESLISSSRVLPMIVPLPNWQHRRKSVYRPSDFC